MKLEQAIARGRVVVKNTQPAEIMLHIGGNPHTLARGQQLDLTSLVGDARALMRVGGLSDLLKKKHLVLV